MEEPDTPQDRLLRVADYFKTHKRIDKSALSGLLGRANNLFYRIKHGSADPLAPDLVENLAKLGVNRQWYLHGGSDDQMLASQSPQAGDEAPAYSQPSNAKMLPRGAVVMLPFVSIAARAGGALTFPIQTENAYELRPYLTQAGQDVSECFLVEVEGDSMYPTLVRGANVLVRPVNGNKAYMQPGIYVVALEDHLFVKRIKENRIAQDGRLELCSDNATAGSITLEGEDLDKARFFRALHVNSFLV